MFASASSPFQNARPLVRNGYGAQKPEGRDCFEAPVLRISILPEGEGERHRQHCPEQQDQFQGAQKKFDHRIILPAVERQENRFCTFDQASEYTLVVSVILLSLISLFAVSGYSGLCRVERYEQLAARV